MDLVRVTEAAALAASRFMGRGDKNGADGAAVDAMRIVLDTVSMDGVVVIGEGEKDEAPMLYNGEKIGDGSPPETDIAVDPIDGTTLTSLGRANALSVIAVSERGTMFNPGPCVYMEKIAVGPEARGVIDLEAPVAANLAAVAKAKGENVRDVTAVILDRDRHTDLIAEVRAAGARIRLIQDGDVAGAISTAWPDSGADILFGIGGTPEGVIAAAALKCMGGEQLGRLWPRDDAERNSRPRHGLRPRRRAHQRRPGARQQLLLRRHRDHRRRASARRSLQHERRHHAEPGHALQVRHCPLGDRATPPREALRVRRRRIQLTLRPPSEVDGRVRSVPRNVSLAPDRLKPDPAFAEFALTDCFWLNP